MQSSHWWTLQRLLLGLAVKIRRLRPDLPPRNFPRYDVEFAQPFEAANRCEREAARRAMRDHDISQRRACRLDGVDPKTVRSELLPNVWTGFGVVQFFAHRHVH